MRTSKSFFPAVIALLLVGSPFAAAPAPPQSQTGAKEGVAIRSIQVVDVQDVERRRAFAGRRPCRAYEAGANELPAEDNRGNA